MTVLNIAMIGSDELAKAIAKATDQRDVHTYVNKESGADGARILSIIRAAKMPEKIRPFFNSLCAARAGLIEINAIDAAFGEALVGFASAGIEKGIFVINPSEGDWVDESKVREFLNQAGLSKWMQCEFDGISLRSAFYELMEEISSELESSKEDPLVVTIDQHFNVKGIGLVAIGYVQSGSVSVHDEICIMPSNQSGTVKSLQVMDDDVTCAVAGDRVGIALRNTKEEYLSGSSMIVHPAVEDKNKGISNPICVDIHTKSSVSLTKSPFQKRDIAVGDIVHASVDLQFVVGRVESIDSQLVINWESPLLIRKSKPPAVLVAQLDSKPRIIGHAILNRLN